VGTNPKGGAQRDHESYLRALITSAKDAIIVADGNGFIVEWTGGAEDILGYQEKEVTGKPLTILMPERYRPLHTAGLRRYRETGVAKVIGATVELEALRKDGTEIPIELSISTWSSGGEQFFSGILRDVSVRKRLERELVTSNERLKELDTLKNDFVAMVAHDLRSPMTVIAGFADALTKNWDSYSDEQKTEFLATIARNTSSLSALIEDVLRVSRIEGEGFTYDVKPFDFAALVARTVGEASRHEEAGEIKVSVPERLPPALADQDRQWQVLTNLLSNAVKYSPPSSPVEVEVSLQDGFIKVAVSDHGYGIEGKDLPRLFEKFTRLHNTEGKKIKGTGLGLYICKKMIEAQGGSISVESRPGRGSTFTYTVPADHM
jgi:PAS domain S-box-containing protein